MDCERTGLRPLWQSGLRPLWQSGLRPFAERSDATTKKYISGSFLDIQQKWRQNLDFEWSAKGNFWETQKSTLLENPISKPFSKIKKLKFCRHFCLHWIHEWIRIFLFFLLVDGGPKKFFYARTFGPRSTCTTTQTYNSYYFVVNDVVVKPRISLKKFYKKICWEKMNKYDFVPVGPSVLCAGRTFGPLCRSDLRSFVPVGPSVLCAGRTFGPLRSAKRDYKKYMIGYPTKNGGKIWILRDRQKGFSERPKKVHFWKSQFQNLFSKPDFSNFAAIFIYIEYMNGSDFVGKWYRQMKVQKNFFTLGPFGTSLLLSMYYIISM